jgi:bifunctional enzyme CysN/CysC
MDTSKDILRFITCGSVDDGKSTLIGRLLYDAQGVYSDQISTVRKESSNRDMQGVDFDPSLFTDGLKAEREQGITIDVAYRYFSTSVRKFIIADTPGHEQYTRNMATGASTCDMAIVLLDARHGVTVQTKRHSFICSLLGIQHIVLAVNKMDLQGWSQERYMQLCAEYKEAVSRLSFSEICCIPVSALYGDNIVYAGSNSPWYTGPTLLHHLEHMSVQSTRNLIDLRMPVQYVLRDYKSDFRGFAGTIASGVLRPGDPLLVLPSKQEAKVCKVYMQEKELPYAFPSMSVVVTLDREVDVSRGSMLVHPGNMPAENTEVEAMLVYMHAQEIHEGTQLLLKHTTNTLPVTLSAIRYKVDVNTMRKAETAGTSLGLNEIARVQLQMHSPLFYDAYTCNRQTGAFILIDRLSNATVAAGMFLDKGVHKTKTIPCPDLTSVPSLVSVQERESLYKQKACTLWFTGLSGSGKSTLARKVEKELLSRGKACVTLDGDNLRQGLCKDLSFSSIDRRENIRRVAEVSKLFNDAGLIVLASFISPYIEDRLQAKSIIGADKFLEIYLDTSLSICENRDPKGLYKKARQGKIQAFTGVSAPYEKPICPDLVLDTSALTVQEEVDKVLALLARHTG